MSVWSDLPPVFSLACTLPGDPASQAPSGVCGSSRGLRRGPSRSDALRSLPPPPGLPRRSRAKTTREDHVGGRGGWGRRRVPRRRGEKPHAGSAAGRVRARLRQGHPKAPRRRHERDSDAEPEFALVWERAAANHRARTSGLLGVGAALRLQWCASRPSRPRKPDTRPPRIRRSPLPDNFRGTASSRLHIFH